MSSMNSDEHERFLQEKMEKIREKQEAVRATTGVKGMRSRSSQRNKARLMEKDPKSKLQINTSLLRSSRSKNGPLKYPGADDEEEEDDDSDNNETAEDPMTDNLKGETAEDHMTDNEVEETAEQDPMTDNEIDGDPMTDNEVEETAEEDPMTDNEVDETAEEQITDNVVDETAVDLLTGKWSDETAEELMSDMKIETAQDLMSDNVEDGTAENLMTDMNLEDHQDDFKSLEPDFKWTYHIMLYPWSDEDIACKDYVKLIRLAAFSQVVMKKKRGIVEVKGETKVSEVKGETKVTVDGKPMFQGTRHGCLHLYSETQFQAKHIMRSIAWKSMAAKEITVEIIRQDAQLNVQEMAYLEINTYPLCKIKWRDRPSGDLKGRTAKFTNLHKDLTRGFLEVVLTRCFPIIGDVSKLTPVEYEDHMKTLKETEGFDGSIDFECVSMGSCRAMVQAHKTVILHGQSVLVTPNDKSTMVIPPFTHDIGAKKKEEKKEKKEKKLKSEDKSEDGDTSKSTPWAQMPGGGTRGKGGQTLRGAMRGMMLRGSVRGGARGMLRGAPGAPPGGPRMRGMGSVRGMGRDMPMRGSGRGMGRGHEPRMRGIGRDMPMRGRDASMRGSGRGLLPVRGSGRGLLPVPRPATSTFTRSGPPVPMTGRQKMNEKLRRNPGNPDREVTAGRKSGSVGDSFKIGDSFKHELSSLQSQLEEQTQALEAKIAALQQSHKGEPEDYYDTEMGGYDDWDYERDNYGQEDYPEEDMYDYHEYSDYSYTDDPRDAPYDRNEKRGRYTSDSMHSNQTSHNYRDSQGHPRKTPKSRGGPQKNHDRDNRGYEETLHVDDRRGPGSPMASHGEQDYFHKGGEYMDVKKAPSPRFSNSSRRDPPSPRYSSRDSHSQEKQSYHNREEFREEYAEGGQGFRGGRGDRGRGWKGERGGRGGRGGGRGGRGGRGRGGRGRGNVQQAW